MPELWAGTDAGKAAHHCTVIDTDRTKVLSRRVPNNEPELLELIGDVLVLAAGSPVTWAVDLNAGGGALLITLLANPRPAAPLYPCPNRLPRLPQLPRRRKTDAKDAYVIADQARMRRDLQPLQDWDEIAVDLKILTARRYDLAADRTRAINRMRAQLLESFPALERAFDYAASKGALVLLTGYQTPAGLRRVGPSRLATWLKNRKVRGAQAMADAAVAPAQAQHTAVAGESTAAAVVTALARAVLALDEEIADIDAQIAVRCRGTATSGSRHGPVAGGGVHRLHRRRHGCLRQRGPACWRRWLAPVPRDSGRISGNMGRPHRYHRRLLRVFYLSAQIAARFCLTSKTFYDRKRAEGKSHKQAILARRRLDVLWALIRDHRTFTTEPPHPNLTPA